MILLVCLVFHVQVTRMNSLLSDIDKENAKLQDEKYFDYW